MHILQYLRLQKKYTNQIIRLLRLKLKQFKLNYKYDTSCAQK
jgi:hypothetical protein